MIGAALAAGVAALMLWRPLTRVGGLLLGAAMASFLLAPLTQIFERRLPKPMAALACRYDRWRMGR